MESNRPSVVSRIFWVTGSLEHQLVSKYLQNKQENGSGALAASLTPKSDKGIWRVKESIFFSQECLTIFGMIPPSFIEKEDDPISKESR